MNQKVEYMAAIDIGTTKTLAIVGRKDKQGKLEIVGIGSTPSAGVKRGVVINIEETAKAIKAAVSKAFAAADMNFTGAFVGIAGQHIKSVKNRGSRYIESADYEITQNDVDGLNADMFKIPVEAGEKIIHVIPQSYIVDNETGVKNPVGISGKRLEANYHIVIGQIASARNIEKCVNRVGLDVVDLVLEPLASAEAVLTEDEKEAGVVLVDIGGGTTDVAVFYDGIIRHTAVIPFGGSVVTNDIKEGCSILQRQAEQLKVQFGSAMGELTEENKIVSIPGISGRKPKEISFRNLAFIIQARMEEIIDAVYYEIENSGVADKLGAGIVLTGGGAMLSHLSELVNLRTGFDVRLGFPETILSENSMSELNNTTYSTAIGLLLKGFDHPNAGQIIAPVKEEPQQTEEPVEEEVQEGLMSNIKRKFLKILDE